MFSRWFRAKSSKPRRRKPLARRRFESLEDRRVMATFTVTSLSGFGTGSIGDAISLANANAGIDTIDFNLTGPGAQQIGLTSNLPDITDTVIIDGYTPPGASANTLAIGNDANILIEIANIGPSVGASRAFRFAAGSEGSIVRGLSLTNFTAAAILVETDSISIEGNFIGLRPDGTADGNGAGIQVINGNDTQIGGTTPAARNVISGNSGSGILLAPTISFFVTNTKIEGNYIGTDTAGSAAIGNGGSGVTIQDAETTFVGSASGGNIIAGNAIAGVDISGSSAIDNEIVGNHLGVSADGMTPIGTGQHGVRVNGGSGTSISGNFIAASTSSAVEIVSSQNVQIHANTIGGVTGFGAGLHGVSLFDTSFSRVGTPSSGNTITGNAGAGVAVIASAVGNTISGNSIFGNAFLGIDLSFSSILDGPTANDALDADTGANNFQNTPVISTAHLSNGEARLIGQIASAPLRTYTLEFFANPMAPASGSSGGAIFLGSASVTTDSSGVATFDLTFDRISENDFFTVTATDDSTGDTSEFSATTAGVMPIASIQDATILEGNSGTSILSFTVSLSSPAGFATNLLFATTPITAADGSDFISASGTVSFAPGDVMKTIDITILGDTFAEPSETFQMKLTNFVDLEEGVSDAVGTITNDDFAVTPLPTLAVTDVTATEGNAGTSQFTFEIGLSIASAETVTVTYTTVKGSATPGEDYVHTTGDAVFNPGETKVFVPVTVNGDVKPEINETFTFVLSAPVSATINDGTGVGVILNDDFAGIVPAPRIERAFQFVRELYLDILGREGDAAGVTHWAGVVLAGGDRGSVARAIIESDEYRGRLVSRMYDEFLDRDAEAAEVNSAVAFLRAGGREEDVIAMILGSDEYNTLQIENSRDFLEGLYQDLFGRAADADGREHWEAQIEAGKTRTQVARAFAASREFQKFLLDDPSELFTTVDRDWYRDYFGRAIDSNGLNHWSNALSNGSTWRDVQVSILGSDEYFTRADGVNS